MHYNPVGILFLAYGIIKIIMVTSLFVIPPNIEKQLETIDIVNLFVSGDNTLAGEMYEYVLLVFAIFSIVHGLALMGVFSEKFHSRLESKEFQYPFYIILGLWLMVFYFLVIYTNVPISKDPSKMYNYRLYGYLGGLSFLLVPVIWQIIERFNPYLSQMREDTQLMYMTIMMLGALLGIFILYIVIKKLKEALKNGDFELKFIKWVQSKSEAIASKSVHKMV